MHQQLLSFTLSGTPLGDGMARGGVRKLHDTEMCIMVREDRFLLFSVTGFLYVTALVVLKFAS